MTLEDLLGSPEAYAQELRETVEVRRESLGERFRRKVVEPLAGRTKGAAQRFTTSAGVGDAAEFRKALKPGWWVLRGVFAAILISFIAITIDGGMQHFYGEFAPFTFAAVLALTVLCVWLSLRLGVRSERWSRNYQRLVSVAGVGLFAIVAWGLYWGAGPEIVGPTVYTAGEDIYYDEYYPGVRDVYVYTEDGRLLTDVYLFDQNGDPLWLGDPDSCWDGVPRVEGGPTDPEYPWPTEAPDPFDRTPNPDEYGYLYPLCGPEEDPVSESPTPDGTEPGEQTTEPAEPGGEQTTEPGGEQATTPVEDATPSPEPTE